METISCMSLKSVIEQLQSFEKQYGSNIPVLLVDKDSPNAIVPLADVFLAEIEDKKTNEVQRTVVMSNFVIERTNKGVSV